MKLITLGTSHGDPTDVRFNSSNVLEVNRDLYIIDAGVPVNALYIRKYSKDFSRVRAIFITHMHDDHIGGLPSFIKSLIKYAKKGQHTHIFLPENVEKALVDWLHAMHLRGFEEWITFHVTKTGEIYRDENICVSAVGTHHVPFQEVHRSFGYRFVNGEKSLLYTGDVSLDFHDFPAEDILRNDTDVCVCECTHYNPHVALKTLKDLPIGRMIFTHVWDEWSTEKGGAWWKQIFSECQFSCTIAQDGEEYEI